MNVISLFDGISCGQVALKQLGFKVDNYYASEIEKSSIEITKKNHPNTIHIGDVNNVNFSDYIDKEIDLIIAGSPCQGFSFQGKQLAFDDPRSSLFFKFVEAIRIIKPKYFLLENVKMKKEHLDVIDEQLGVKGIFISSRHFSAQDRKRYYWTNIPFDNELPDGDEITTETILENIEHQWIPQERIDKLLKKTWRTLIRNIEKAPLYTKTKMPTLLKQRGSLPFFYDNGRYRYPTAIELERLQTLPDNYTDGQSYNNRVERIGNAWTVETVKFIFKNMDI